jgi:CMP-2-keto-3-deoxyoctulosonic acid synthetase
MLGIDDEQIIVNVQGDEPMLGEQVIKQVANNLARQLSQCVCHLWQ